MTLSLKHLQVRDRLLALQERLGRKPLWKEMTDELKMSKRTLSKYLGRLEKEEKLKSGFYQPEEAKAAGA